MDKQILFAPKIKNLERDGKYILIDPIAPNWVATNKSGFELLRQIDGRKTLAEVVSSFNNKNGDIGLNEAYSQFLKKLIDEDFVKTQPDLKPQYPGRSGAIAPKELNEIWIYTNNNCNFKCSHCLVSDYRNDDRQLSLENIKRIIDEAVSLGAKRFYFTGGEPFLRRDIFELIDYAARRANLVIMTNGSIINRNVIKKLSKYKDRLILQISLEGSKPLINDKIRGKGSFEKIIKVLKSLVESGFSPIVSTTVIKNNIDDLKNIIQILDDLEIKTHHLIWFHLRGQGLRNFDQLYVKEKDLAKAMLEIFKFSKNLEINVDNEAWLKARLSSKKNRKSDLCNSCWEMMSIAANGYVYPCPSLNGDTNFDCGNILDINLSEIWLKSAKSNWIRENTVEKKVGCNNCYLKFLCGGGCYCQAYYSYKSRTGTGCLMAPDPYCEAYKILSEEILFNLCNNGRDTLECDQPILLGAMGKEAPSCTSSGTQVINGAFDVSAFHCSCVMKN